MTEKQAEQEYQKKLSQMKTGNSPLTYVAIVKDEKNTSKYKIEYGVSIGSESYSGDYDLLKYYRTDDYINDKDIIKLLNSNLVHYGTDLIKNKTHTANVTRSGLGRLLGANSYNESETDQIVCREKVRPIKAGVSIGNSKSPKNSGTLGCFFSVQENNNIYFLSNKHVLSYYKGIEKKKNPSKIHNITQPSKSDASELGLNPYSINTIGKTINEGDFNGIIDAEFVLLKPQLYNKGFYNCTKTLKPQFSNAVLNNYAYKVGRTTLYTQSKILSVKSAIKVENIFDFENKLGKYLVFEDQIMTEDIASKGDSGSLLVDAHNHNPIGLTFADINFSGFDNIRGHCHIPKKVSGRTFHNKLNNVFSTNKKLQLTFKSFLT